MIHTPVIICDFLNEICLWMFLVSPSPLTPYMYPTHEHECEHAHTHPQSLFIPVTKDALDFSSTSFIVLAIMFHIMICLK